MQAACRYRGQATPLIDAVKRQDGVAVNALLDRGVDVNAAEGDGATALHWAAQLDDLATVELLLEAGAAADAANRFNVTPARARQLTTAIAPSSSACSPRAPIRTRARAKDKRR